jgi:hypothetical protein
VCPWSAEFNAPIPLPKGRQLVTVRDAGKYITKLPKTEHEAQEWQAAMEALILVTTSGGPTMFARIGVMRALNRHVERVFAADRPCETLSCLYVQSMGWRSTELRGLTRTLHTEPLMYSHTR